MYTEDDFFELNSKFYNTCQPTSRAFTLLTIPFILFAMVLLCYLKVLPLKIELHSVVLIAVRVPIQLRCSEPQRCVRAVCDSAPAVRGHNLCVAWRASPGNSDANRSTP